MKKPKPDGYPDPDDYTDMKKWQHDYNTWMNNVQKMATERVDKIHAQMSYTIGTGTRSFTLNVKDFREREGYGAFFAHFGMSYENVIELRRSIDIALKEYTKNIRDHDEDKRCMVPNLNLIVYDREIDGYFINLPDAPHPGMNQIYYCPGCGANLEEEDHLE